LSYFSAFEPLVTGILTAEDVFIAAFLEDGYDVCSLDVYNPCRGAQDGKNICLVSDGTVECVGSEDVSLSRASPTDEVSPCRDVQTETPTSSAARMSSCLQKFARLLPIVFSLPMIML